MGTWTLKYTTGYNANTWTSKAFATYTAGDTNEEITSMSAYFGVAASGIVYGPGTETNTDWDKVTGNGVACSLTMFSGDYTATVSVTATCGRSGASTSGYYPTSSDTEQYTWTFSSPIPVSANSTVTIYCAKPTSTVLCNGNGSGRKGNVTGVAGVPTRYIYYDANGGTGAPATQSCVKGVATTVSSTKPTKSSESLTGYKVTYGANGGSVSPSSQTSSRTKSYTFSTWNTTDSGTGTSYNSGTSITITNNTTLYARYTESIVNNAITTPTATRNAGTSTYTVTFNGNGGTSGSTELKSTATVTYSAKGWYTAASGGTYVTANGGSYTPTAATILYQQWNPSTGSYSAITLPSASRTGYTMLGWATSSTATSASYSVGASYTPTASTTLYAVWEAQSFTVTYNANGGTGTMSSGTATYGSSFTPAANGFTYAGRTFTGWNEAADGSGASWTAGTAQTWSSTANITLYAQWESYSYTVNYDGNGATSGTMSSSTHTYGDNSKVRKNTYALPGYNFMGWSNSSSGAVIVADQGTAPYNLITTDGQVLVLYAVWSQDSPWTLAQIRLYDSTNNKWWTC